MDAISASEKPIHTIIVNKAASAAYGLASQSSSINAENDATRVGSVGTVIEMAVPQDTVVIASSNAPNKRPDPRTEEGRAVIQAELDDIANLFSERIARGRGVSIKKINADFGRGGVVLAKDAINRGMIDSIGPQTIKKTSGKTPEANMDLNELKSKHPDVYAAAVTDGVKQERDRVSAHLELGEAYAALDTAIAAVKSGDAMSMAVMAKYVAAGANRGAIDARQKEDPDVPGTGGSDNQDGVVADRVLARAFELCGVSVGGAV
jgi:ClpP class serine protease